MNSIVLLLDRKLRFCPLIAIQLQERLKKCSEKELSVKIV